MPKQLVEVMSRVYLVVYGEPVGKKRPKVSMKDGIIRTYTPAVSTNYEHLIAKEYKNHYSTQMFKKDEPIKAIVNIFFGLRKSDYGKYGPNKQGREKLIKLFATKHTDIDNVLKSVFDALNEICYPDDCQIVAVESCKMYSEKPRVEIVLESGYEN